MRNSLEGISAHSLENINDTGREGLPRLDDIEAVARCWYEQNIKEFPGLAAAFREISPKDSGPEGFTRLYAEYVESAEEMKEHNPAAYDFMKSKVFPGREFSSPTFSEGEVAFGMRLPLEKLNRMKEYKHINQNLQWELPQSHREYYDLKTMENMTLREKTKLIGEQFFNQHIEDFPGSKAQWEKVMPGGNKSLFGDLYSRYIMNGKNMEKENFALYHYFRENVFCGKEYLENLENANAEISFSESIANKSMERNPTYEKWEDGLTAKELPKGELEKIANSILRIFSNDHIEVHQQYLNDFWSVLRSGKLSFNNAAMDIVNGRLVQNPKFLAELGNRAGREAVISVLAHEVGHREIELVGYRILNEDDHGKHKLDNTWITRKEHEMCADYLAGLVTRLAGLPSKGMEAFFDIYNSHEEGKHYLSSSGRIKMFQLGYTRIDRGEEALNLHLYGKFNGAYDNLNIYHDKELVKKILMNDVIAPYRKSHPEEY